MIVSLVTATAAALAPAPLAKLAIDDGINRHDTTALDLVVVAFLASAVLYGVASYAQTYLVGLGRPARPAGPADRAIRAPAEAVDLVLLAPSRRA